MGQGLGVGTAAGFVVGSSLFPAQVGGMAQGGAALACVGAGLSVDLMSDILAKQGKVIVEREVILNAAENLLHCSSYYCLNGANPVSKFIGQKHEFLVLRSETKQYYTIQKNPRTGDVTIDVRNTNRQAVDLGLLTAKQPTGHGEVRLNRMDQDFDLPNDLQVAYLIAWSRKEDPRWALTTENSKHMTTRLRFALQDF